MGIVASQCPSARDAALLMHYLTLSFDIGVFKTIKKNSTTIKHIYTKSANIIEGCNVAFDTNDC